MQGLSSKQLRLQKIASIKSTLSVIPIIKTASTKVQQKIEKNKAKMSVENILSFSNAYSDDEESQKSQQEFHSFFKDKYQIGQKIGQGAHGVVRKCYEKQTGKLYAAKTINLDTQHILYLKKNFIQIKRLQHEHICKYKAIFFQLKYQTCHLIMDYLPYPDLLHTSIQSQQMLKKIIYQVLQTIKYIHQNHICHRDIKPQNILYDKDLESIKIIDFGISKNLIHRGRKSSMLTVTGTPYYRAPEMFEGGGYDQAVDMWALGVTIFKLMTGYTPFESEYHSDTIANIVKGQFKFPISAQKYSIPCKNFVSQLLKKRQNRLRVSDALHDIWFYDLHHADQFTRSLTLNQKFNHHEFDLDRHSLIRENTSEAVDLRTSVREKPTKKGEEEINIKFLIDQISEEKQIYGMEEEQIHSSKKVKSSTSIQK